MEIKKYRIGEYIYMETSRRYCVQEYIRPRKFLFFTIPEKWKTVMDEVPLCIARMFIANNGDSIRVVADDEPE